MNKVRMTELLDEATIEFAWLTKSCYGLCIFEDKHIVISHVLSIADTLIHELIHLDDPDKEELEVCEETLRTIQRLTVEEIADIVKYAMDKGALYEKAT